MEEDQLNTLFLGTGWSFPPAFNHLTGEVQMVAAEEDIHQSLNVLLSTALGERIMQPDYGCNLNSYVFEPMNSTIVAEIKDLVKMAIVRHESRIKLNKITINLENELEGELKIELEYTIATTNSRSNYVYPYYLKEGTNT